MSSVIVNATLPNKENNRQADEDLSSLFKLSRPFIGPPVIKRRQSKRKSNGQYLEKDFEYKRYHRQLLWLTCG
jgi:hypothetical protein